MATMMNTELPLTEQQKKNRAQQLAQAGLSPTQGIANMATDAGGAVQAGAESVQRGLAQQGRAINTVAGGIGEGVAAGANYLNRGDPARDAAGAIGRGIDAVGQFFTDSAAQARTSDYGQMVPGDRSPPAAPAQQQVQSQAPASAPIVPAGNPSAAPVQQAAPAATAPAVAAVANTATRSTMPSIGDLAPGTGMIRNSRTGKVSAIGDLPAGGTVTNGRTGNTVALDGAQGGMAAPVMQIARTTQNPAAAAGQQIALHDNLMAREDGGIGEGLVARGALNKAKALSGIASDQQQADTSRQRLGIDAFEAQSRDSDRRDEATDRAEKRKQGVVDRKMRNDLAELNDQNDPGGARRSSLKQRLAILSGKENDHFQPVLGKDDMGNPMVIGVFNKQTGAMHDTSGQPVKSSIEVSRAQNDAQAAIAKGMDKNEVNRRLLAAGFPAVQ